MRNITQHGAPSASCLLSRPYNRRGCEGRDAPQPPSVVPCATDHPPRVYFLSQSEIVPAALLSFCVLYVPQNAADIADPDSSANLAVRTGLLSVVANSLPEAEVSVSDITVTNVTSSLSDGSSTYSLSVSISIDVTTTDAVAGQARRRALGRHLAQEGGSSPAAQLAVTIGSAISGATNSIELQPTGMKRGCS